MATPAAILAEAEKKLKAYIARPESLDPTLASALLEMGARNGGEQRFDEYRRRMAKATTPEQRDLYMAALADFRKPALARKLVDLTLTDEIRGQDLWRPLARVLDNTATQAEAWAAMRKNWAAICRKTGPKGATRIIEYAAFADRERLEEIRAFFAKRENQVESSERPLAQSLESIELGIRFRETQSKALSEWLNR